MYDTIKAMEDGVAKKGRKLLFLVTGFFLAPVFSISPVLVPHTYAAGGVFGGKMSVVAQCTCSVGHVISVGPPRPGTFHFVPGKSKLFQFNQISKNGVWVLGIYTGGSACLVVAGKFCILMTTKYSFQN